MFEEANDVKVPYDIAPRRAGDIEQVWSDPQLANKVLRWKAKEDIIDTLKSAWKWQLYLMDKKEDEPEKQSKSHFKFSAS